MAIINLGRTGARRSMTDPARWQRKADPVEEARVVQQPPRPVRMPEPAHDTAPAKIVGTTAREVRNAAAEVADTGDNVDRSLRDRIRRISRRPEGEPAPDMEERPRRSRRAPEPERAELKEEAFTFTPAGPKGRDANQAPPAASQPGAIRQSARRRSDAPEATVPARRAPSEPEVHETRVQASESEIDMLRSEIDDLRREMAEMKEAISHMDRTSAGPTKGLGAVERTMQRLAERMDRIDGGAQPQISSGQPAPRPRKRGFFSSLFG